MIRQITIRQIFPYQIFSVPRAWCAFVIDMSILQYFKRAPRKSSSTDAADQFPEPNGPLSRSVPPKAIELANASVAKVKDGMPRGKRSGPYLMLSGAQRFEIGKRAAEHGVTASLR